MKFFSKVKEKVRNSKGFRYATSALCVGSIAAISAVGCFAAEDTTTVDMTATLQSALTDMLANIMKYLGVCLPIALTVFGLYFGIKWAINFFKGVAKGGGGN